MMLNPTTLPAWQEDTAVSPLYPPEVWDDYSGAASENLPFTAWSSEASVIAHGLVFSRSVNSVFCDQRTRFQWQRYTRPASSQVSVTLTTVHLSVTYIWRKVPIWQYECVSLLSGDQTAAKMKLRPGTHSIWWECLKEQFTQNDIQSLSSQPHMQKVGFSFSACKRKHKTRQTSTSVGVWANVLMLTILASS